MPGPGECDDLAWGFDNDYIQLGQLDWAIWPSLDPRPWCRFGCGDRGCGSCGGCCLPTVPTRTPVYKPRFATGMDLWRHAMPRDISPDDARLEKGERGPTIKAGPPVQVGGMEYAAAMDGVSVEHRSSPGLRFGITVAGLRVAVDLETDHAGVIRTSPADLLRELAATDLADAVLAYARPIRIGKKAGPLSPAPPTGLKWCVGTMSYKQGAPASTFTIVVECMRSGYLTMRPQNDQLILAQFRASLNNGASWTMTRPYDEKAFEIESSGLWFQFGDGGAPKGPPPFQKGQLWTIHTRESLQITDVIAAAAADMVTLISVSEVVPLKKWEADLRSINAILATSILLRGPRGIDASPKAAGGYQYDEEIAKRAKEANQKLADIADAYTRLVCEPGGDTDGVDATSRPAQARGMDLM